MSRPDASRDTGAKRGFPGPKRHRSKPVGPEQVREAVLDAAERLFGLRGVDAVSLRDIAHEADVKLPLIARYVGRREELIAAVFEGLSTRLVDELEGAPLEPLAYGRDSLMDRWLAVATHYSLKEEPPPGESAGPVGTLAGIFERSFGIDTRTAHLRAAQVAAISAGWRTLEGFLTSSPQLAEFDLHELRVDLNAIQREIGATPWPTPPARRSGSPQGQ